MTMNISLSRQRQARRHAAMMPRFLRAVTTRFFPWLNSKFLTKCS